MAWHAKWVAPGNDPTADVGVFEYRLELRLDEAPEHLLVRVSADQRYKLWVNGELISFGPQRGDLDHWFYDWFDLGPHLREGENELRALVWNFGWLAPQAQFTRRTAFMVEVNYPEDVPEPPIAEWIRTPGRWKVSRAHEWSFGRLSTDEGHVCPFVGPGEILSPSEARREWMSPVGVTDAQPRGTTFEPHWMLLPRTLPAMRYEIRRDPPVVRHGFLGDPKPAEVEGPLVGGSTSQNTLLDFQELLCAYPRVVLSGPEGTVVTLTYAEAMWTPDGKKLNRDDVSGKEIRGFQDQVVLGTEPVTFEPLWWRTFRFLQIQADHEVQLENLEVLETGYPYEVKSSFEADDARVKPLWDVSIRTAERCAGETYFDCPYYEQLQYAGDSRIQALIGYYLSTDRRLQRNAVDQFGWSINDLGLTQSRYPNHLTQIIPPFSLWWVLMREDQRLYDRVPILADEQDPIDTVGLDIANAFNRLSAEPLDRTFWNFGDWVKNWEHGVPPGGIRSTMHMLTLYLAHAASEMSLDSDTPSARAKAASLFNYMSGQLERVDGLIKHSRDPEWRPSEHIEALWRQLQRRLLMPMDPWPARALEAKNAAQCTYYFAYYKHLAMQPQDYLEELAPWTEMIQDGLTTFAENPGNTRSDCHAWSAHPALGFFQVIAGVTSSSPGWKSVRIAPNPGTLRRFDARIAHPDGELRVAYDGAGFTIETPVPATLEWQGKRAELGAGVFRT